MTARKPDVAGPAAPGSDVAGRPAPGSDVAGPAAPVPKRLDTRRVHHEDVFLDPYEWLRDKSDPEVIAHLEAENTHVEDQTAYLEPLRQRIFDEIKSRTKETDLSVPTRRGDWWYYGRSF